jgi:hypothetical protein
LRRFSLSCLEDFFRLIRFENRLSMSSAGSWWSATLLPPPPRLLLRLPAFPESGRPLLPLLLCRDEGRASALCLRNCAVRAMTLAATSVPAAAEDAAALLVLLLLAAPSAVSDGSCTESVLLTLRPLLPPLLPPDMDGRLKSLPALMLRDEADSRLRAELLLAELALLRLLLGS